MTETIFIQSNAWGAERSQRFDLAVEDAADHLELNEVIWRSIRGPDSPMPAPRRAAWRTFPSVPPGAAEAGIPHSR
jgi:hypothetical protein